VILAAIRRWPAQFFALLVIAVAFLPVMALEGQEEAVPAARLHQELRMVVAAVLALTLDPRYGCCWCVAGGFWPVRAQGAAPLKITPGGRIRSQEDHPITGRSCGGTSRCPLTLRWKSK